MLFFILSKVLESIEKANREISFTHKELQLLYAACMNYGDKMSGIIKSISNEEENVIDRLSDRTKDSWNLARKITEYMEDKS